MSDWMTLARGSVYRDPDAIESCVRRTHRYLGPAAVDVPMAGEHKREKERERERDREGRPT